MKIAIIGWGSLIWCPGSLQLDSMWHKDGPELPVEFSRISQDGRLTLVIVSGSQNVTTLWALSAFSKLDDAIANLQKREGANQSKIGWISIQDSPGDDSAKGNIKEWLGRKSLDAAVWTNLGPKNMREKEVRMNERDALEYIKSVKADNEKIKRIEEYIRNTPSQINTPNRVYLRSELGWSDNHLSPKLFEKEIRWSLAGVIRFFCSLFQR